MGLADWAGRLFGRPARVRDEVSEVLGEIVDKQGRRQIVRRGPVQHESLSQEQLERIARLRDVLIEAYPMTLDGWVDGFLRDANPESKIQIIEACAVVFQRPCSVASVSSDEKRRIFNEARKVSVSIGERKGRKT